MAETETTRTYPPGTRWGDIAVTLGFTTREMVEKAFDLQKNDARYKGVPIGEVMVAEGMITRQQNEHLEQVQKELRARMDAMEDPSKLSSEEVTKMITDISAEIEKRAQLRGEGGQEREATGERAASATPMHQHFDVDFLLAESAAASVRNSSPVEQIHHVDSRNT